MTRAEFVGINKLHQLLKIALDDLALVELDDENYKVNMGQWHKAFSDKCFVCLAGSVMAKSLNRVRTINLTPWDWESEAELRFRALNFLREGKIKDAAQTMKLPLSPSYKYESAYIPDYHKDKQGWWRNIRKLQKELKEYDI